MTDPVNHPAHYTSHPSGVECIDVTEHMNFCIGNAVKYLWRAGSKDDAIQDLKKAAWYIEREITRLSAGKPPEPPKAESWGIPHLNGSGPQKEPYADFVEISEW